MGVMEVVEIKGCCTCIMAMLFANWWRFSKFGWMMMQLTANFLKQWAAETTQRAYTSTISHR